MDGILNVDKPAGPTSHDIVARLRRVLRPRRIGHAGTLDPLATGVLLVCLDSATRIVEFLMDQSKEYRATALLGVETDTEDQAGVVVREADCSHITRGTVESVLPQFTGSIMQVPPMVSAVHHGGRRLYELARAGEVVERAARPVEIYSLRLVDFHSGDRPEAVLDVKCSRGTYIRTLCADIGRALGCGAHMSSLVRTAVGEFRLEQAVSVETIEQKAASGRLVDVLHPIAEALRQMPSVAVSEADAALFANGVVLPASRIAPEHGLPDPNLMIRVHGPGGRLLGIGKLQHLPAGEFVLKPEKVFPNQT